MPAGQPLPDDHALRAFFETALTGGSPASPDQLCRAATAALPVDRTALLVTSGRAGLEVAATSDEVAALVSDAQVTTGEGPAVTALHRGGPVLVPDLAHDPEGRWPAFLAALGPQAAGGLHALPLQLGAIRIGVLDLHRDAVGPLPDDALAQALTVAEMITTTLLLSTGGHLAGGGDLTGQVWPDDRTSSRVVHQATGMVLAQLGVSAGEAYVRLRAHAFAHDLQLTDVARAVVERRLRLPAAPEAVP